MTNFIPEYQCPVSILETSGFSSFAKKHLSETELDEIKTTIACDPKSGSLIRGTGGVRKIRVKCKNGGKSGGYRILYYYHADDMPIFFLMGYSKTDISDVGHAARNAMKKTVDRIVASHKNKRNIKRKYEAG